MCGSRAVTPHLSKQMRPSFSATRRSRSHRMMAYCRCSPRRLCSTSKLLGNALRRTLRRTALLRDKQGGAPSPRWAVQRPAPIQAAFRGTHVVMEPGQRTRSIAPTTTPRDDEGTALIRSLFALATTHNCAYRTALVPGCACGGKSPSCFYFHHV